MTPVQELDSLNCPLRGLFLIEAAAGTGKTYNIQNLVVRAVLERDIPIEKLLVVTYTRAARPNSPAASGRCSPARSPHSKRDCRPSRGAKRSSSLAPLKR